MRSLPLRCHHRPTRALALLVGLLAAAAAHAQPALTLEQRVDCRAKVEDVYWSHRTWPAENHTPKPPREAVLPRARIAERVAESLRYEAALERQWHRPLTPAVLQAELERQARDTRDPQMLRELWAALGDDPYLIAECLVRPELAERRLQDWYATDRAIHAETRARAEREMARAHGVEELRGGTGEVSRQTWALGSAGQASPEPGVLVVGASEWARVNRELARALVQPLPSEKAAAPVGTLSPLEETRERFFTRSLVARRGTRITVATVGWPKVPFERWWSAERTAVTPTSPLAAHYALPTISATPCIDSWSSPPGLTGAMPSARTGETSVWTGAEMIVWGGSEGESPPSSGTGGRYSPATDTWRPTSQLGAPSPRIRHSAVWTGTEMIVWGGEFAAQFFADGGRYSPSTDSWTPTSMLDAPATRTGHLAVWTGAEMIVWSGDVWGGRQYDGGRYDPAHDSWRPTTWDGAPRGRQYSSAVWTGEEMIVWGGWDPYYGTFGDGARYRPSNDTWTPISSVGAPAPRSWHTAVWTGHEMLVWGGGDPYTNFVDGGRYDPVADRWLPMSTADAPTPRVGSTTVWSGTEMIVWGGWSNGAYTTTGARYAPSTDSWRPTAAGGAPSGREDHTAVWTGSEMLVWGGASSRTAAQLVGTGGRYSPSTDSWAPMSTGAPLVPRWHHTAVWTGSEMVVWGGSDGYVDLGTGARYAPVTDSWRLLPGTRSPSPRHDHTAVWTGSEMVVWGGGSGNDDYASGARYAPAVDRWTPTDTWNAPAARRAHSAVWTGSEMIVWGGTSSGTPQNTGGRYAAGSDLWSPVAAPDLLGPRFGHAAVWTGDAMIVWGGTNGNDGSFADYSDGGVYSPSTNRWSLTGGYLSGRHHASGIWSGSHMIVWGGWPEPGEPGDGASYEPLISTWSPLQISGAPSARSNHSTVWSGDEMFVWGGMPSSGSLLANDGGRYRPQTDSWSVITTVGAPAARAGHTAVWTGNAMIVWGGRGRALFNDGALYCARPWSIFADGFELDGEGRWLATP